MPKTVFFIRGFMRSGTNWLHRILNLHPDINCTGEFHLQELNKSFTALFDNFYLKRVNMYKIKDSKILEREFHNFIKNIISAYCGDYPIVGDRTPTGLANFILPDCKYIIITRDGRDVLVSWFFHAMKNNHPVVQKYPEMQKKRQLFLKKPDYFTKHPFELLDHEACFKHVAKGWNTFVVNNKKKCEQQAVPFEYYWIKYEDLHAQTEKLRNEMYTFLGADPNTALPLNANTKPGAKKEGPMGHNRKGIVGDWELHFTDENRKWFAEAAHQAGEILDLQNL